MTPPELSPGLHERIEALAAEGDALAAEARYEEAIGAYDRAWALVPEPKHDWEASTWLLAAIGDAAFLGGRFDTARKALDHAMTCPARSAIRSCTFAAERWRWSRAARTWPRTN